MSHNKIIFLDSRAFNGLGSLKTLNLSFNKLPLLDAKIFFGLINLETINLESKDISSQNKSKLVGWLILLILGILLLIIIILIYMSKR